MSAPPRDSVYYIKQQGFETYEIGLHALNSQYKLLKQLSARYPDIDIYMGLSTHDSHNARKIHRPTEKAGRRKVGFMRKRRWGKFEVTPHIHIYISGYYAATLAHEFCEIMIDRYYKSYRKKYAKSHPFSACKYGEDFIPCNYVERQSTNTRTIGDLAGHEQMEREHRAKLDLLIRGGRKHENPFDNSCRGSVRNYIFYSIAYGYMAVKQKVRAWIEANRMTADQLETRRNFGFAAGTG